MSTPDNSFHAAAAFNIRQAAEAMYTRDEEQSGIAYRYKPFDPAQFCVFADDFDLALSDASKKNDTTPAEEKEAEYWKCVNCGRTISKKSAMGNKPIVICHNPSPEFAENAANLEKPQMTPKTTGGVVPRKNRAAPVFGVGFEMKKVLGRLKIDLPATCSCNTRVMMLNDMGIDEVEKIRDKIMVWFEDEAHKRAMYFDHDKANKIIDISIRRAKKQALKYINESAKNANVDS